MLKRRLRITKTILVCCSILIWLSSSAINDFNIKYLSTADGLSNNYVTSVCQDEMGFIWFGTRDGLSRWDGQSFKTFRHQPSDSTSLPDNFIRSLAADGKGNIWIGTNQAGAIRYNIQNEKFHSYPINKNHNTSFPSYYARNIFKQNDSTLWFGTNYGLALYETHTDSFKQISLNENHTDTPEIIISVFTINANSIGIQSNTGLYKITNGKVEPYQLPQVIQNLPSLLENNPIFIARNGDLWFADPEVLYHIEKHTKEVNRYINQPKRETTLTSNDISGIFEDSKNNIWIITWDGGVNLFHKENKSFTRFNDNDEQAFKLSDKIVTSIFEDSFENIWITTEEGGVNYISLKENRIRFFKHNAFDVNSLHNNKVASFYCSPNGTVYIGTSKTVLNEFKPDKQSFAHHFILQDKTNSTITGIKAINENEFYIAGWGLGLHRFNKKTGQSLNVLKRIPELNYNKTVYENIRSFTIDNEGRIWLCTHSDIGLAVYDPEKNKVYTANNPGPLHKKILSVPFSGSILMDSKNRIWITSYSGLYMYNGKQFYEFKASDKSPLQISSNYVYSIYEDNHNNLWVGSSVGLDKITILDDQITIEKQNNIQPNLPENIKNIIGDNSNRLWLSSNHAIVRYNMDDKKTRSFQINRDIPVIEFSERACARANSGELYFGTTQGFLSFHPDSMELDYEKTTIFFTDFKLFNESQSVDSKNAVLKESILSTDTVYLTHQQNAIGIEFTPLQINTQEESIFEYKLSGVDKTWVLADENRLITYTNIAHGTYQFNVRETQNHESKSSANAQLTIIIAPPFWKTNLAYLFYILISLLALYIFRRAILNRETLKNDLILQELKIQNVEETNLMKLRFFTNISHEFRTPLTLIKVPLEKLIQHYKKLSPEEKLYQYELMLNSTNRLDKMVTQLMDYRKMEAGSLVLESAIGNFIEFCHKIFDNFKLLAQQKQIDYSFSSEIPSIIMAFDADKMEKVLSNILSNAFKNTAPKGKVTFSILKGFNKQIEIQITDSGYGIPEKDLPHIFERFYMVKSNKGVQGTGIGLALAKELIAIHQGEILVESTENKGSTFTVQIPSTINASPAVENDEDNDQQEEDLRTSAASQNLDKLLIVDDDPDMLAFLNHELSLDFDIITATNGQEGIEMANQEKPHLVLSDVMMPFIDGIELCETLKKNELTSHIPVILLTARHSDEAKIEGLGSGANAFLMKPFNLDVLLLTINNILDNRKQLYEQFKTDSSFFFENKDIESTDQKLIQGIIDLVLENITNSKINADFIAKRVFISRTVLYLKIEALTGQTVNEFIAHIRLKKAKQLLLNPGINISEVSYKVGYASQSYFSRSFAKAFGYSPREYINNLSK